jgi:hypothetical protein
MGSGCGHSAASNEVAMTIRSPATPVAVRYTLRRAAPLLDTTIPALRQQIKRAARNVPPGAPIPIGTGVYALRHGRRGWRVALVELA